MSRTNFSPEEKAVAMLVDSDHEITDSKDPFLCVLEDQCQVDYANMESSVQKSRRVDADCKEKTQPATHPSITALRPQEPSPMGSFVQQPSSYNHSQMLDHPTPRADNYQAHNQGAIAPVTPTPKKLTPVTSKSSMSLSSEDPAEVGSRVGMDYRAIYPSFKTTHASVTVATGKVPRAIKGGPTNSDVLCGRGGRTNKHIGNKKWLHQKKLRQRRYFAATKDGKTLIAQELVEYIHNNGGRFIKKIGDCWYEIDDHTARTKASQTLREMSNHET